MSILFTWVCVFTTDCHHVIPLLASAFLPAQQWGQPIR